MLLDLVFYQTNANDFAKDCVRRICELAIADLVYTHVRVLLVEILTTTKMVIQTRAFMVLLKLHNLHYAFWAVAGGTFHFGMHHSINF